MNPYEERIAELEEEVRQLRALFYGSADDTPLPVSLGPNATRVWQLLWNHRGADKLVVQEAAISAVYPNPDDECLDPLKMMHILIHRIRRRLGPYGVKIETVHGIGWRLMLWPQSWEKDYAETKEEAGERSEGACAPGDDAAERQEASDQAEADL